MAGQEQTVGAGVDVARLLLLRDMGRAFNSSLDLDHVFQLVLEKVLQVLAAEAASIWLIQDASQDLFCETAIGPVSEKVKGLRLPWGTGIVGWVAQNAKPVIVADAQKDRFLSKQVDEGTGFVTRSMICAPMVAKGKCLGAIQMVNKVRQDDLFTRDDLELLVDMAIDAAIAVENARLYQAESKVKELQALLKISREITSTLDLDRILGTLVNILSTVITYDRASLALLDGGAVKLNAISGTEQIDRKDPGTVALEGFLQDMAQHPGATYLVKEGDGIIEDRFTGSPIPAPAPNAFMKNTGSGSVLVLPLRDEEGLIGLLCLESRAPGAFGNSQIEIVSILGAQATVAIRNAQLYKHVPTLNMQGIAGLLKGHNRRAIGFAAAIAIALGAAALVPARHAISGAATVMPSDQVKVMARQGGRVMRILVEEGEQVKAGQLLAELDAADLELQLAGARTTLEVGRVRMGELRLASDAGALALEEIKARQATAEARLLEAKIAATRLTAPIAGVVVTPRLHEKIGAMLARGDALLDLARMDRVTVDVTVPETQLDGIQTGQPVAVRLLAFPTRTFRGAVRLVSPTAETGPSGSTFTVRAQVDGAGARLRGGMQGSARIEAGSRPALMLLLQGPLSWLQLTWWRLRP